MSGRKYETEHRPHFTLLTCGRPLYSRTSVYLTDFSPFVPHLVDVSCYIHTKAVPNTTPAISMKTAAMALLGVVFGTASACVELQGIVPDGGEGLLDLLFLLSPEKSLGNPLAPLDIFTTPVVPTVSEAPSRLLTAVMGTKYPDALFRFGDVGLCVVCPCLVHR